MNCQTLQNRILALPDPRQVPDAVRGHLDACPACAAWWRQAARLERLVERLPAPPAPAARKAALIAALTAPEPIITSIPALDRRAARPPLHRTPAVKYLAGLAAAVLVAVGGWALLRPGPVGVAVKPPGPRDPLLDKVVRRDLALARATTPDQRLEVLAGLADDLSAETRALARVASASELQEVAGLYGKAMRGLGEQADGVAKTHALSPAQKAALFDKLAAQLADAGRAADQTARESPPHAQPVLKAISTTARDGQSKLRALARRES